MPELPSVEATKDVFNKQALKKPVLAIQVKTPQVLEKITVSQLQKKLKGRQFKKAQRHGKYMLIETDGPDWLILHFGLRGGLKYEALDKAKTTGMMRIDLKDNCSIIFTGLYGKIALTDNPEEFLQKHDIGPDALDITLSQFQKAIEKYRGSIKALLMDQHIIAGLGNVYVDEVLFQAGIHPKAATSHLSTKQVKQLYSEIQSVLKMAIGLDGKWSKFTDNYLTTHRESDRLCPRCGEALKIAKIAGRTTYFCPLDQII